MAADHRVVSVGVSVELRRDRPALFEVAGILAICALLLVGLAKMDNSAARREAARAHRVLAEQAAAAAARDRQHKAEEDQAGATRTKTVPVSPRTESLGSRGPIAIPVGAAWSPGTSASVAHAKPVGNPKPPEVPSAEFRRIIGPTAAAEPVPTPAATPEPEPEAERPRAVVLPKTGAPATMRRAAASTSASSSTDADVAPAAVSGHERRDVLLTLMAACGALMCAAGFTLLRRAR